MMIFIIFSIIFGILLVVVFCKISDDEFIGAFIIVIGLLICNVVLTNVAYNENLPNAMDVYQGKTTLQVTYQDSIPIDSVVVYKNDYIK